jgi:hypothetical protein
MGSSGRSLQPHDGRLVSLRRGSGFRGDEPAVETRPDSAPSVDEGSSRCGQNLFVGHFVLIAGADASAEQKLSEPKAQIDANRNLSISLAFDPEPARRGT